jgi:hypothetical protein
VTKNGETPMRSGEDVAARVRAVVRDLTRDLCRPVPREPGGEPAEAMAWNSGAPQARGFVPDLARALRLPPDAFAPRPANDAGTAERGE